jgi:hypothetical protein
MYNNPIDYCGSILYINSYLFFLILEQDVLSTFQNYQIVSATKTFSDIPFYGLYGFGVICDGGITNYGLDIFQNYLIQYDVNWQYIYHVTIEMPVFAITIYGELYVSGNNGMFKIDSGMNILGYYKNVGAYYGGIYYNRTTDHILVTSDRETYLQIFDRFLNTTGTIDTSPFSGSSLYFYNGRLYGGTTEGYVLVIEEESLIYSFSTACDGYISSVLVDDNGFLVVVCFFDNSLYLYNLNGTFMGLSQQTESEPIFMGNDANGKLILTSHYGFNFFN